MSKIIDVQQSNNNSLLNKQGVEGTAIGEKWIDGRPTGEQAILIFVQKKHSEHAIADPNVLTAYTAKDLIPKEIEGIRTDVIEVGHITKQVGFRSNIRPVQPGYSCGHGQITAGTIGGIFLDKNNKPVLLSNNHVIANENIAKIGDPIYQPGPADQRIRKSNIIGHLAKFAKIKRRNNIQDSAIAYVDPNIVNDIYPEINQRLSGFAGVQVGQSVQKCGRTTGYTTGRILGLNASFTIQYDFGMARFDQCIVISAMSQGGDSGSIIQDMAGNAVGLLFAGSNKVTIANPIDIVRQYYGLQIYSEIANNSLQFGSYHWKLNKDPKANSQVSSDQFTINALKNHYCCLETPINSFNKISCDINTGSDVAIAWGPGISVHWPNGFIKLNLRHNKTFGGYTHLDTNFDAGRVKPNTTYSLRIVKSLNSYIGEINDNGSWIKVIEVPKTLLANDPILLRIGKTDGKARCKSHKLLGKIGQCSISNIVIN